MEIGQGLLGRAVALVGVLVRQSLDAVRQTRADGYTTEVYLVASSPESKPQVLAAVQARLAALRKSFPGVTVEDRGAELRLDIPRALRTDHEAHFGEVATRFLGYLRDRRTLPAWERPNMLAKYYVTTTGTELSRRQPSRPAARIAPK